MVSPPPFNEGETVPASYNQSRSSTRQQHQSRSRTHTLPSISSLSILSRIQHHPASSNLAQSHQLHRQSRQARSEIPSRYFPMPVAISASSPSLFASPHAVNNGLGGVNPIPSSVRAVAASARGARGANTGRSRSSTSSSSSFANSIPSSPHHANNLSMNSTSSSEGEDLHVLRKKPSLPSLSFSSSVSSSFQSSDSPVSNGRLPHHSSPKNVTGEQKSLKDDASEQPDSGRQNFSPRERLPSIAQLDLPFAPPSIIAVDRRSSLTSNTTTSSPKTTPTDGLTNNYFPGGIGDGSRRQSATSNWLSPLRGGVGSGGDGAQGGRNLTSHQSSDSERGQDLVSPRSANFDDNCRLQKSPLESKSKPEVGRTSSAPIKRSLDYGGQEDRDDFPSVWKRRAVENVRPEASSSPSILGPEYPPLPRIRNRSVSDSQLEPQWTSTIPSDKPQSMLSQLSKSCSAGNDAWFWENSRADEDQRRGSNQVPSSLPAYDEHRSPSMTSTLSLQSAAHLLSEERANSTPGNSFRVLQEDVPRRPNTAGSLPRYSFNPDWNHGSSVEHHGQGHLHRTARSHSPYPMTTYEMSRAYSSKSMHQTDAFVNHHAEENHYPGASWSHEEATGQLQGQLRRSLPHSMPQRAQAVAPGQSSFYFTHQSHVHHHHQQQHPNPRPTTADSSSQAHNEAQVRVAYPSSSTTGENKGSASLFQAGSIRGKTTKINPIRRRGKLPKETTEFLRNWLMSHADHPYPTEQEKKELCVQTGLTMNQICNWMINGRRRILLPAMESAQKDAEAEEAARQAELNHQQHHHQSAQERDDEQHYLQPVTFRPPTLATSQAHAHAQQHQHQNQHLPSPGVNNASYPSLTSSFPFSHRF